jgi:hypothetical protein
MHVAIIQMLDGFKRTFIANRSRNMARAGRDLFIPYNKLGTRWRSWLKHCSTSRKVTGSIPDGVTGIFPLHNPSGHTVFDSWVDSDSNRNEHQEYFLGGKGGWCVGLTTYAASTAWNCQGLNRDCFIFLSCSKIRLLLCWYSWSSRLPDSFW